MDQRRVWLFDLDNTLHDASHAIFPLINRQMTAYIERHLQLDTAAANALRQHYWQRYGATLLGLMRHHRTDPEHFLSETHQLGEVRPMMAYHAAIRAVLRKLPGRKFVFSNGPQGYAWQVLRAMKLSDAFDGVFTIEHMRYQPKPALAAFHQLLRDHRLRAGDCIMVEDSVANLLPAKRLGMRTIWISDSLRAPAQVDLRLSSVRLIPRALRKILPMR